ncbi:MAG: hypothetical protein WAM14_02990 [Candidatus Nitrosopolaris sp.]
MSILTTNISINFAMAASKGNRGGAFVVQEQVNTGNPKLDKEVNKFYSCISKAHQDPPSIQIVDNCYYQTSIGGISGGISNNNHDNNNVETHSTTASSLKIARPPPGVLIEVPA